MYGNRRTVHRRMQNHSVREIRERKRGSIEKKKKEVDARKAEKGKRCSRLELKDIQSGRDEDVLTPPQKGGQLGGGFLGKRTKGKC